MNAYWKMGLYALVVAALLWLGWDERGVHDKAALEAAEAAKLQAQQELTKKNNQVAADYEAKRQTMEGKINDLTASLARAQRKTPNACRVPTDIVRAVNSAAGH